MSADGRPKRMRLRARMLQRGDKIACEGARFVQELRAQGAGYETSVGAGCERGSGSVGEGYETRGECLRGVTRAASALGPNAKRALGAGREPSA